LENQEWLVTAQAFAVQYGWLITKALLIFFIGKFVAKMLADLANNLMKRKGMDDMLRKFIRNILYAVLLVFVVIATIGALGIQTASIVAVVGAAGLAIGLALQGSLSNFAAGVLMIIFRPYKLGDWVNVAGTEGIVEEVEIFTTVLRKRDRTKIIIPNGLIMSDQIFNYTDEGKRRVNLIIGIGYDDDIDHAREVILTAIRESEHVLPDPEPTVSVSDLGDSCVNLTVRPWVSSQTHNPAVREITERIKKALDAAGISIPYPQRDIHVFNHEDDQGE